jgi:hypothetical protein
MQDPGTKESLRRKPVKYIALCIGSAEVNVSNPYVPGFRV